MAGGEWRGAQSATAGRLGAERCLWTLTVFGYHQVAAGRTAEFAEARSRPEAALASYAVACREVPRNGSSGYG